MLFGCQLTKLLTNVTPGAKNAAKQRARSQDNHDVVKQRDPVPMQVSDMF